MTLKIFIYTDGSYSEGSGGYASIIIVNDHEYIVSGGIYKNTTSSRMELISALKPLLLLSEHNTSHLYSITVYSDSIELVSGINKWGGSWKLHGWKTQNNQDVKNQDLWKNLQEILELFHDIKFQWIRGHSKNRKNDKCDKIAKDMRIKAMSEKCNFTESELPEKII